MFFKRLGRARGEVGLLQLRVIGIDEAFDHYGATALSRDLVDVLAPLLRANVVRSDPNIPGEGMMRFGEVKLMAGALVPPVPMWLLK